MSQKKPAVSKTSRYWCFTWNNYSVEEFDKLLTYEPDICKHIVIGREVCPTTGTPHIQGYVEWKSPVRQGGCKALLDPKRGKLSPVHVEPTNAQRRDSAILYCKKGEQPKDEYLTLGVTGPTFGKNASFEEKWFSKPRAGQGARTDWKEIRDFIENNPDFSKVLSEYPEYAIRYTTGIKAAIDCALEKKNSELVREQFKEMKLRVWQQRLFNELQATPDSRKIIWYVDPVGNSGKSTMCDYLKVNMNCLGVQNNKTSDVAHAYRGQNVITFDFTRTMDGQVNYSVIESVKNGRIFSPKYDSVDKMYAKPWVVCFSNFEPLRSAFSEDRWDIRYINESDCQEFVLDAKPKDENVQPGNTVLTVAPTEVPAENNDNIDVSDEEMEEAMGGFFTKNKEEDFKLEDAIEESEYSLKDLTDEEFCRRVQNAKKTPKNKRKKTARKRPI